MIHPHLLVSKAIVTIGLSRQIERLQARKRVYQQIVDSKEIERWQLDAFNRRWIEACAKYRFYGDWKKSNGLPDKIDHFDQLRQFPVLRKSDIQANFEKIAHDAEPCSFISTGGSTGEPTRFPRVKSDLEWIYSSMYLGRSWWNINPADPIMLIWGHSHLFGTGMSRWFLKARRNIMDWMINTKRLDAYRLDDRSLAMHWLDLVRNPGSHIVCYTSVIRRLLDYLEDSHIDGGVAKIRGVILTSETIGPSDIERIHRHLGAPTIIEYGMAETGVLAYSKPTSHSLHFFWDAFHTYLGAGDELIITTLHDARFPLINYGTEDRAESVESVVPFVCKGIRGRVFDLLMLTMEDGTELEIYGELFVHIIKVNPALRSFFIHQKGRQIDVYLRYANSSQMEQEISKILHELKIEYPSVDTAYIRFHRLREDMRTLAGKQHIILREP